MPDWLKILHSELEALSGLADINKLHLVYLKVVNFIKHYLRAHFLKENLFIHNIDLKGLPLTCRPAVYTWTLLLHFALYYYTRYSL